MKQKDTSIDDARVMWDQLVNTNMTYIGDIPPALNEAGIARLAELIKQKKVGRWDEPLTDEQLVDMVQVPSLAKDTADLIWSFFVRTNEARKFVTPPTPLDETRSLYQLVSQIFKALSVKQDA